MTIAENLADILARIEAARKAAIKPAPATQLVAVSKTVPRNRHPRSPGCRPTPVRREPGAGSARQISGAESRISRPGIASDRAACRPTRSRKRSALFDCIQTLDRTRLADALAAERDKGGRMPAPVPAGQYRRGTAKGRRLPARGRRADRLCPQAGSAAGRADVHPAGGRRCRAAFRAAGQDRARQRACQVSAWA